MLLRLRRGRIGSGLAARNLVAAAVAVAGAASAWGAGGPADPLASRSASGSRVPSCSPSSLRARRAADGPWIGASVGVPGLKGPADGDAFVAASCPPCRRLAPTLLELAEAHPASPSSRRSRRSAAPARRTGWTG